MLPKPQLQPQPKDLEIGLGKPLHGVRRGPSYSQVTDNLRMGKLNPNRPSLKPERMEQPLAKEGNGVGHVVVVMPVDPSQRLLMS